MIYLYEYLAQRQSKLVSPIEVLLINVLHKWFGNAIPNYTAANKQANIYVNKVSR